MSIDYGLLVTFSQKWRNRKRCMDDEWMQIFSSLCTISHSIHIHNKGNNTIVSKSCLCNSFFKLVCFQIFSNQSKVWCVMVVSDPIIASRSGSIRSSNGLTMESSWLWKKKKYQKFDVFALRAWSWKVLDYKKISKVWCVRPKDLAIEGSRL